MSEHLVSLKSVLGWISGTVAVISLVLGVAALNAAVRDWREIRASVEQLVAGADTALAAGDFRLAKAGYDQATQIDASSPSLREGAMNLALAWLRNLPGDLRDDETLQGLTASLFPSLYEGLEGKSERQQSVIWAHIGWAHHLAELDRASVRLNPHDAANIGRIYERAASLDDDNFYTPLFQGFLSLDSDSDVAVAERYFERAIALAMQSHGRESEEYHWARKMSLLGSLNRIPPRPVGEIRDDEWGLLLVRTLNTARTAGEALPEPRFIDEVFDFYRRNAAGDEGFAMLMTALPLDEHRLMYEWLLASETATRWLAIESNRPALLAFRAALLEGSDPGLALNLYREIYRFDWLRDELRIRIEEGIARLSGEQPPRMVERLGRNYAHDPIPADGDPYAFHLETLMNFDLRVEAPNNEVAFEYVLGLAETDAGRDARMLADVTSVRDRLLEDFRELKRYVADYGYTSGNSRIAEIIATRNVLRAHRVVAVVRIEKGLINQALAELDDAFALCGPWVPGWQFELRARALSRRNAAGDLALAADNLARFIDAEIRYGGALDWNQVKTHPDFTALRETPRYRELMRGR